MPEAHKTARIGVRIPPSKDRNFYLPGWQARVYDADTGIALPAESVDLHMKAGEVVSATVTVLVSEVTLGDAPAEPSDA